MSVEKGSLVLRELLGGGRVELTFSQEKQDVSGRKAGAKALPGSKGERWEYGSGQLPVLSPMQ